MAINDRLKFLTGYLKIMYIDLIDDLVLSKLI